MVDALCRSQNEKYFSTAFVSSILYLPINVVDSVNFLTRWEKIEKIKFEIVQEILEYLSTGHCRRYWINITCSQLQTIMNRYTHRIWSTMYNNVSTTPFISIRDLRSSLCNANATQCYAIQIAHIVSNRGWHRPVKYATRLGAQRFIN